MGAITSSWSHSPLTVQKRPGQDEWGPRPLWGVLARELRLDEGCGWATSRDILSREGRWHMCLVRTSHGYTTSLWGGPAHVGVLV